MKMRIIIVGVMILAIIGFVIAINGGTEMQLLQNITPSFLQGSSQEALGLEEFKSIDGVISQDQFLGWRKISHSGNESILFNVTLNERTGEVELIPKFIGSKIINECVLDDGIFDDRNSNFTCKNVTYFQPTDIRLATDRSSSFISRDAGKFTYTLNASESLFYKFGEQSIIIVGDISYDSTDTNVTQETGFAHLNISRDGGIFDSLVLYQSFDDNVTNGTYYDYSGHGTDLIGLGLSKITDQCVYGNCLDLTDSGITGGFLGGGMANHPELQIRQNFTITAWVNVSLLGNNKAVFSIANSDDTNNPLFFLIQINGRLQIIQGSGSNVQTSVITIGQGTWHFIAVSSNGTAVTWYINETSEIDGGLSLPLTSDYEDDMDIVIGGIRQATPFDLEGSIDEFMVFNISLNASQISDIFNNQSARFAPLGFQNFTNEDIGDTGDTFVNISLAGYQSFFNTNISVSFDDSTYTNFSADGTINDISLSGVDPNFVNISFIYQSNNTATFYTPLMIGNITLTTFGVAGDTCTPPGSGDWNVHCQDNCVISTNQDVPGNLNLSGTPGTFNLTSGANLSFTSAGKSIIINATNQCFMNVHQGSFIN